MIIICGKSGAGKTTTVMELQKLGYKIINTYTTRPLRDYDMGTVQINSEAFKEMLDKKEFLSHVCIHTVYGTHYWGLRRKDFQGPTKNTVVVGALDYIKDIRKYFTKKNDIAFFTYLDVDDAAIIRKAEEDLKLGRRVDGCADITRRLVVDEAKNRWTEGLSDFVVHNKDLQLSPAYIAKIIVDEYKEALIRW